MKETAKTGLTDRQRAILKTVVEEYVQSAQPVGSKTLVDRTRLPVSSSTVRGELAELEQRGLLTHPHTSAGRVPTERGYRFYVDELLDRLEPRPPESPLELGDARREVEDALRETTEMLSRVTRLLALASAPPIEGATVRHVELLLLQPQVVMVVVITSTGGVTKGTYAVDTPVDPGLVRWAGEYLAEELVGLRLGTRTLRQRFDDSGLSERERAFLATLRPAFTASAREEQRLFVGGAAVLLDELRADDSGSYRGLLEILEQRAAVLDLLAWTLDPGRLLVRVGDELDVPELRELSLVGASYGLTHQSLGAVSLLGPLRMDYDMAIRSVRGAALELSRFVEGLYGDN